MLRKALEKKLIEERAINAIWVTIGVIVDQDG